MGIERIVTTALCAAFFFGAAAPACADSEIDRLHGSASLTGAGTQRSLVQQLTGRIQKDRFIGYADWGWDRKVERGAYLPIGQALNDERRAGFYLGLEEDSVRFLFKIDLGVPDR